MATKIQNEMDRIIDSVSVETMNLYKLIYNISFELKLMKPNNSLVFQHFFWSSGHPLMLDFTIYFQEQL